MQILKNAKPNESHIITLKFVVKIKENKIATNSISLYYVKAFQILFSFKKSLSGSLSRFSKEILR